MMVEDEGIYASADTWQRIRTDPAFIELMRLARVTNALTLAYPPILHPLEDQSPPARRERIAAILYAAALLHEGLHTAQGLGQHYRDLAQYRDGFAQILRDPRVRAFRSGVLDKVRDRLVFHFDRDSLAEGLSRFPDGECLIATTTDFTRGQTYFDAADDALLGYLFGEAPTEAAYNERLSRFLEQVTDLFNRYLASAHRLIPAVLRTLGCYRRPVARPLPPQDAAG